MRTVEHETNGRIVAWLIHFPLVHLCSYEKIFRDVILRFMMHGVVQRTKVKRKVPFLDSCKMVEISGKNQLNY